MASCNVMQHKQFGNAPKLNKLNQRYGESLSGECYGEAKVVSFEVTFEGVK